MSPFTERRARHIIQINSCIHCFPCVLASVIEPRGFLVSPAERIDYLDALCELSDRQGAGEGGWSGEAGRERGWGGARARKIFNLIVIVVRQTRLINLSLKDSDRQTLLARDRPTQYELHIKRVISYNVSTI